MLSFVLSDALLPKGLVYSLTKSSTYIRILPRANNILSRGYIEGGRGISFVMMLLAFAAQGPRMLNILNVAICHRKET